MRISIEHHTRSRYATDAVSGLQRLRLWPAAYDGLEVLDWRIEAPGIEQALSYVDGFGNRIHQVSHREPHDGLRISVYGEVETGDRGGVVKGLQAAAAEAVYLRATPLTRPDAALRELAQSHRDVDPLSQAHQLMQGIRDQVEYQTGTTEVATTAAEALARGHGVCQDHTHVFITAARVLGLPARYVTGYLLVGDGDGAVEEAHHAWAEVRIPDLGWVGFDVANRVCPTEAYVRLAAGLDYQYAAPVRGVRSGGGEETLDVQVMVQQQQ